MSPALPRYMRLREEAVRVALAKEQQLITKFGSDDQQYRFADDPLPFTTLPQCKKGWVTTHGTSIVVAGNHRQVRER